MRAGEIAVSKGRYEEKKYHGRKPDPCVQLQDVDKPSHKWASSNIQDLQGNIQVYVARSAIGNRVFTLILKIGYR